MILGIKSFLKIPILKLYVIIKKLLAYKNVGQLAGAEDHEFLKIQIDRFFDHLGLENSLVHATFLLPIISNLNEMNRLGRILIIGPANKKAMDAFEAFSYDNYDAIDLVGADL